jgi:hypothetical protein
MAFRAKSLDQTESPAQNKVQRRAMKLMKKLKLEQRIEALADEMTPDVMMVTSGDQAAARRKARQWITEGICELLAARVGEDVVFLD